MFFQTIQDNVCQFLDTKLAVEESKREVLVLLKIHGIDDIKFRAYINTNRQRGQNIDLLYDITILSNLDL